MLSENFIKCLQTARTICSKKYPQIKGRNIKIIQKKLKSIMDAFTVTETEPRN